MDTSKGQQLHFATVLHTHGINCNSDNTYLIRTGSRSLPLLFACICATAAAKQLPLQQHKKRWRDAQQ